MLPLTPHHTTAPDGTPLAWHEVGQGPPLLALPGLGLTARSLALQLPLARSRRLLALDWAGTGGSRPWRGFRAVDEHADDAVRVLDAAGVARTDLLGVSFGGSVGLRLLARHPDRVRRVAFTCTALDHRPDRARLFTHLAEVADREGLGRFWQEFAPWVVGPRLGTDGALGLEAIGRALPLLLATDGPVVAGQLRALLALPEAAAQELRAVRTPVLLVQGARDRLVLPVDTARLLDLLPDARALTLPRSGHLVPLRAHSVNTAVREFLNAA